jgi:hypothetical protein
MEELNFTRCPSGGGRVCPQSGRRLLDSSHSSQVPPKAQSGAHLSGENNIMENGERNKEVGLKFRHRED